MRKLVSTFLFALLTWFSGTALAVFNGPEIPLPLPLTQDGRTYNAYVQTWHPHYRESRVCYYSNDFNQSYAPVIAKSNVTFGYVSVRVMLNPASFGQAWDNEAYNNAGVLCAFYYNGNWYNTLSTPNSLYFALYGWNDWYFNNDPQYQYDHNLSHNVRAVGIDVKLNATYDFQGQFFLGSYAAGDVVIRGTTPPSSYFSFPMTGYTAYQAPVTSIMDNDTLGNGAVYVAGRDGNITAFNGEVGMATAGCKCYSTGLACNGKNYQKCAVPGYARTGSNLWTFGWSQTPEAGKINYSDNLAYYDAHPGYDYGFVAGTPIYAPADGTLCIAHSDTTKPKRNSGLWRDPNICPLSAAPGTKTTAWKSHHVFYILHGPMHLNGSVDEYITMFLHSNNLENDVLASIYRDGYAAVKRLQEIAAVGSKGTGAPHLHIEFYKKNSAGEWMRVDPYGNGVSGKLW